MSAAANNYGGWITDAPTVTGSSSGFVRIVGWLAVAGVALTGIGTGGELSLEHLHRTAQATQHSASIAEIVEAEPARTPSADLARIREVLKPAISDLATTFGVSRQSIYNWLNGEAVADGNAAKLRDLAQAADVLAHEGITVDATLLKRKFSNGKTLLQVVQAGESARDAAALLVQIHRREVAQRERMNARFSHRAKTPATADFDLPASNDHA
ncbi:MAG: hypothetical protein M0T84_18185 [Betaproteobacteria bacterium]|nr:hypothetical protein [Betaproteobacteria bacterium]